MYVRIIQFNWIILQFCVDSLELPLLIINTNSDHFLGRSITSDNLMSEVKS